MDIHDLQTIIDLNDEIKEKSDELFNFIDKLRKRGLLKYQEEFINAIATNERKIHKSSMFNMVEIDKIKIRFGY
jgi:hypothetical protein